MGVNDEYEKQFHAGDAARREASEEWRKRLDQAVEHAEQRARRQAIEDFTPIDVTAACEEERKRSEEIAACLRLMVDEMGIGPWMHEQDKDGEPCPEDDTCACPKVARINAALRALGDET